MKIRIIIRGILGYFPLILKPYRKGTGGTSSARYCYSVWLRHLSLLKENGMHNIPETIAEIGPGDSLGIGLNALITGSDKYYAFDIINHSSTEKNISILKELIVLYKNKTPIPDDKEFPNVKPKLKNYDFPSHILNDKLLSQLLNEVRLNKIHKAIILNNCEEVIIKYIVPWNNTFNLKLSSVDLIYSQAVMEHVLDVNSAYQTMHKWLKKEGFMSHEIDYSAHETHKEWYGHWKYPMWIWKIIMKGRLYYINRYPNSFHIKSLINSGFKILKQLPDYNKKATQPHKSLQDKIQFTKEDMQTVSNYIITKKM